MWEIEKKRGRDVKNHAKIPTNLAVNFEEGEIIEEVEVKPSISMGYVVKLQEDEIC